MLWRRPTEGSLIRAVLDEEARALAPRPANLWPRLAPRVPPHQPVRLAARPLEAFALATLSLGVAAFLVTGAPGGDAHPIATALQVASAALAPATATVRYDRSATVPATADDTAPAATAGVAIATVAPDSPAADLLRRPPALARPTLAAINLSPTTFDTSFATSASSTLTFFSPTFAAATPTLTTTPTAHPLTPLPIR